MASITIHSSSTIVPSSPTPTGTLSFSGCDLFRAWTHIPSIFVYKSPVPAKFTDVEPLKTSLAQILVPYYPLAGRIHWIPGGRLELDCCAAGVLFVEASSTAKLKDYGDFAPSDAVRELAPSMDYDSPIEELPPVLAQLTRFRCGGVVIGISICHTLVDGPSYITFINSWASMARGHKTVHTILQPLHDRSVMQPTNPVRPPRFHHTEFFDPPVILGSSDPEEERKKETECALLKLTKEQIEKLKKIANSNTTTESMRLVDEVQGSRPYSRYESITAHIWVCACKARSIGGSAQPTVVRMPVDVRRRLKNNIPENFTGNSSFVALTPQCEYGELMSRPLSYAAGKIREGTSKMSGEYAQSAIDFIAEQEDISWTRTSFHSNVRVKASFWGNPNIAIGSWMSIPMYDVDFGWGKPNYAGPTVLNTDGKTYIMPGSPHDGSLIVAIKLQTRHMKDFKNYFYQTLLTNKL